MASAFNFHNVAFVQMKDMVASLTNILQKAKASSAAPSLPGERIVKDMHPLTFQVASIADMVEKFASTIEGTEPSIVELHADKTWEDIDNRLSTLTKRLNGIPTELVNKAVNEKRDVELHENTFNLPITDYFFHFLFPNTYFHLMTAYNICRKEGVALGKFDFMFPHAGKLIG